MTPSRCVVPLILTSVAAAAVADPAEAFLSSSGRQLSNQTKPSNAWKVYNVKSTTWGNSVGRVAYFDDTTRPGFAFSGSSKTVRVDQYRNGVKHWSGDVLLWKSTEYMVGSCSPGKCTAMARRVISHGPSQWQYGDEIHVQVWEAAPPAKGGADDSDSGPGVLLVVLLVIVILAVLGACGLGAFCLYRRRQERSPSLKKNIEGTSSEAEEQKSSSWQQSIEEPSNQASAEAPEPSTTKEAKQSSSEQLHNKVYPSRWCVTPEQFAAFMQTVHRQFPDADTDPTVQEVVDAIVKPLTSTVGTSYALYMNPGGVPCKHFVAHAWQGGVKQLGQSIADADPCGGIWIDFLAVPQTLSTEEAAELMGKDLWNSPCAKALTMCAEVIHVRNPKVHLLSRLWCVFELFLAHESEKPVTLVGCEGDAPAESGQAMGLGATCTRPEDLAALRAALDPRKAAVNEWLDGAGMVVAADL